MCLCSCSPVSMSNKPALLPSHHPPVRHLFRFERRPSHCGFLLPIRHLFTLSSQRHSFLFQQPQLCTQRIAPSSLTSLSSARPSIRPATSPQPFKPLRTVSASSFAVRPSHATRIGGPCTIASRVATRLSSHLTPVSRL